MSLRVSSNITWMQLLGTIKLKGRFIKTLQCVLIFLIHWTWYSVTSDSPKVKMAMKVKYFESVRDTEAPVTMQLKIRTIKGLPELELWILNEGSILRGIDDNVYFAEIKLLKFKHFDQPHKLESLCQPLKGRFWTFLYFQVWPCD